MMDRRHRDLAKLASRYGYTVAFASRHYSLRPENGNGPTVTAAISPRNATHWLRQVEADLKRASSAKGQAS